MCPQATLPTRCSSTRSLTCTTRVRFCELLAAASSEELTETTQMLLFFAVAASSATLTIFLQLCGRRRWRHEQPHAEDRQSRQRGGSVRQQQRHGARTIQCTAQHRDGRHEQALGGRQGEQEDSGALRRAPFVDSQHDCCSQRNTVIVFCSCSMSPCRFLRCGPCRRHHRRYYRRRHRHRKCRPTASPSSASTRRSLRHLPSLWRSQTTTRQLASACWPQQTNDAR